MINELAFWNCRNRKNEIVIMVAAPHPIPAAPHSGRARSRHRVPNRRPIPAPHVATAIHAVPAVPEPEPVHPEPVHPHPVEFSNFPAVHAVPPQALHEIPAVHPVPQELHPIPLGHAVPAEPVHHIPHHPVTPVPEPVHHLPHHPVTPVPEPVIVVEEEDRSSHPHFSYNYGVSDPVTGDQVSLSSTFYTKLLLT